MDQLMFFCDLVLLLLYSLTSFIALLTNGLICRWSFHRRRHIFSPTIPIKNVLSYSSHRFLLNLAVSDALSGLTISIQLLFCSKYLLERFTLCSYICLLTKSLQILASNSSILTVCIIAFDRYRIVQNPFQHYDRRRTYQIIVFIWLFSSLFSLMSFISLRIPIYFNSYEQLITCKILFPTTWKYLSTNQIRKIRLFCLIFLFHILPFLIITSLCLLTARLLARRRIIGVQQFRTFEQSRTRSIRLLIIILIAFTFSHLPLNFLYMRDIFLLKKDFNQCQYSTIYFLFYWLSISSCCHNPIIYSWFNRTYRNSIFNWYRSIIYCRRHVQTRRQF